ncbi:MAG: zinc ribbon domain-containing protein [Anaerolineales bacterium]|nr:zinc ribbon domain-containing protein [Anaerolineales bacterium]
MRTRTYPLRGVVYCAHCEAQAKAQDNPGLRTRLTGALDPRGKRRYKHMAGVTCGVTNRTVPADDIEAEVGRLLKLLTVREDALEYLTELAMLSRAELGPDAEEEDLEQRKRDEIALCQRRIDAAVHLYGDGRIAREEYLRRVEENERQIVHWQARTTESERKALELSMCIEAVNRISSLWDTADDEDRQGMPSTCSPRLCSTWTRGGLSATSPPWADDFLMLRMELYYNELGAGAGQRGYESGPGKQETTPF